MRQLAGSAKLHRQQCRPMDERLKLVARRLDIWRRRRMRAGNSPCPAKPATRFRSPRSEKPHWGTPKVRSPSASAVPIVNHWQNARLEKKGSHDPVVAAASAMLRLLYNPQEVSTYDVTFHDGAGAPLSGSNRYVLRLAPPPPVNAFWSLSMYSAKTFLFVERIRSTGIPSAIARAEPYSAPMDR